MSSRSKLGGKAQEPSLYLLERIKSIIVTLFSKVEAKEKKRREAALGLVAYKIRVTTVSNIVISCEFWEMVSVITRQGGVSSGTQSWELKSEMKETWG